MYTGPLTKSKCGLKRGRERKRESIALHHNITKEQVEDLELVADHRCLTFDFGS